jgi:hypothetical protein
MAHLPILCNRTGRSHFRSGGEVYRLDVSSLVCAPREINIQRHKCEPAYIGLLQNGLVIDDQRSSIMWTRYELISCGFFLTAVTLTGLGLLSTLFFH